MKNINKALSLLFVMTAVVLLIGCSGQKTKAKDDNQVLTIQTNGEIERADESQEVKEEGGETENLEEVELVTAKSRNEWQDGVVYVDTTVKNNSKKELKQVVIELNLLNENKEVIESVAYPCEVDVNSNSEYTTSIKIPNGQEYYDFDVKVKSYKVE